MKTFLFTPGPWRLGGRLLDRSPCDIVATTSSDPDTGLAKVYLTDPKTRRRTTEYEANAVLILQAPLLAEALRQILQGSEPAGRWLDASGNECAENAPGARFEEYTPAEQQDWLDSVARIAREALEPVLKERPE